jgi:hypothetical protein
LRSSAVELATVSGCTGTAHAPRHFKQPAQILFTVSSFPFSTGPTVLPPDTSTAPLLRARPAYRTATVIPETRGPAAAGP